MVRAGIKERILIIPDTHFPKVHPVWLRVMKKVIPAFKPHRTILLGDHIDAACVSSHPSTSFAEEDEVTSLTKEYEECLNFIKKIPGKKIYIEGNHEWRVERRCLAIGGKWGRDVYDTLSPKRFFTSNIAGLQWVDYIQKGTAYYTILPGLVAVHGLSHAKNAAQKHLNIAKGSSIVFGHTHRIQYETSADLSGRPIEAWSPGCGSELRAYWRHGGTSEWRLGFGTVLVSKNGEWSSNIHKVHESGWTELYGKVISI